MIGLELCMKYPGEDLSEIDREYNVLSEGLRVLELQNRETLLRQGEWTWLGVGPKTS
jgi:hypothetical protein